MAVGFLLAFVSNYYISSVTDPSDYKAVSGKIYTEDLMVANNQNIIKAKFISKDDDKKSTEVIHTVKKGETLYKIASFIDNVTVENLVELNHIENENMIYEGQRIKLK
ncbi:LysM domain protein [compost metagenome]